MNCKPPFPAAPIPVALRGAAPAVLLLALLSACVSPAGDYPDLSIREAELIAGTPVAPRQPYAPPPPAPAVLDRAEALAQAARSAHDAFMAQADSAARVVEGASGASAGSEAWARAEVALASLISARSQAMVPVADLDRLYVEAAVEGSALARISAVRDAVEAQIAQEDATIARLQQVLAR